jgi:bifunctional UDP-N-acetylglucosamine pyrophosphorylase / glucosamine-1-phosphate N-acetyltransferase
MKEQRYSDVAAVILAAGLGTRMKSRLPKALHELAGRPLLGHVLAALDPLGLGRTVIVVGHGGDKLREYADAHWPGMEYATQEQRLGTGHALMQAAPLLQDDATIKTVLVLMGDAPLITTASLRRLIDERRERGAHLALLTAEAPNPYRYGRIVRSPENQRVRRIIEEKDASDNELLITEINTGIYALDHAWLWQQLPKIIPSANTGEYYLTDLLQMAAEQAAVAAVELGLPGYAETIGIDDRVKLAEAEATVQTRLRRHLMLGGVTMPDPSAVYLHMDVQVGEDTIILPGTFIERGTMIGSGCEIGPNTRLRGATVGNRVRITASYVEDSVVEDDVDMGPFCHLRGGTHIESHAHLGNFVEMKKTRFGRGSADGHFSYLGDATIGRNVNIGAGSITANYDGTPAKKQTVIEDGAFIGVDTMMVAPLQIGAGAHTGAGAVVRRDVPPGYTAVGIPARNLPPKGNDE